MAQGKVPGVLVTISTDMAYEMRIYTNKVVVRGVKTSRFSDAMDLFHETSRKQ